MAAYITGFKMTFSQAEYTREWTCRLVSICLILYCFFLALNILCCSVHIVRFSGRFWLAANLWKMAANDAFIAAYCWFIAVKSKQFYYTSCRFLTANISQIFWQKLTFSGSLWKLDFLSAYDSFMTLLK